MSEPEEAKPPSKINLDLPKKVGIIYSEVKRKYFPTEAQYLTEKDAYRDAQIVAKYLEKLHIKPLFYPGGASLAQRLRHHKPDMVINLVGSVDGFEYLASAIPGVCELLDIPYTGATILGESLSYNKFLVKKLFEQMGIPVPRYQLFANANDFLDPTLRFPLIAKLNEIHGAVEITKDSVVDNEKQLRERLKFLIKTYDQHVLVEEFIVGREITAFLFEGLNKKVYFAERIIHKPTGKYTFASYELQWLDDKTEKTITYRKYNDPLLKEYIKKAFEITKMSDYGKFDVRIDSSGRYFFLDSNSNPAFGPKEAECPMAFILELYDVPFTDILKRLILNTMRDMTGKSLLPMPNNHHD
jgi:D-alanine-D-alanine ligase